VQHREDLVDAPWVSCVKKLIAFFCRKNPGTSIKIPAKHQHPDPTCRACWDEENRKTKINGIYPRSCQWFDAVKGIRAPTRISRIAENSWLGRLGRRVPGRIAQQPAGIKGRLAPDSSICRPAPSISRAPRHLEKASIQTKKGAAGKGGGGGGAPCTGGEHPIGVASGLGRDHAVIDLQRKQRHGRPAAGSPQTVPVATSISWRRKRGNWPPEQCAQAHRRFLLVSPLSSARPSAPQHQGLQRRV